MNAEERLMHVLAEPNDAHAAYWAPYTPPDIDETLLANFCAGRAVTPRCASHAAFISWLDTL